MYQSPIFTSYMAFVTGVTKHPTALYASMGLRSGPRYIVSRLVVNVRISYLRTIIGTIREEQAVPVSHTQNYGLWQPIPTKWPKVDLKSKPDIKAGFSPWRGTKYL